MDFNGDGHRDVLSGSFPGEVHVFLGKADGSFAAAVQVVDHNGDKLRFKASVPYAVDWDRDGDLDLIVGDIQGYVYFVENKSGTAEHKFRVAGKLSVGGEAIRVPGGDSGPVVVDWDGDGHHDLLLGAGDGSVGFYRNTARSGAPQLAAAHPILPSSKAAYRPPTPDGAKEAPRSPCGLRTKLAVADWNGDKKLDLLVGDFESRMRPAPELTSEQMAHRDKLQAQQQELMPVLMAASKRLMAQVYKSIGLPENHVGPVPGDKQEAFGEAIRAAYASDEEMKELQATFDKVRKELAPLMPGYEQRGGVYVMLRE